MKFKTINEEVDYILGDAKPSRKYKKIALRTYKILLKRRKK